MVGREAELAPSCAVARWVGEAGLLLITGEAGIGKTRLVEEAAAPRRQQGFAWLEGRTLSFGRTSATGRFLEIIQQDAGIESDDAERERWAKLAARVAALFGSETPEILPYLATLLASPCPRSSPRR